MKIRKMQNAGAFPTKKWSGFEGPHQDAEVYGQFLQSTQPVKQTRFNPILQQEEIEKYALPVSVIDYSSDFKNYNPWGVQKFVRSFNSIYDMPRRVLSDKDKDIYTDGNRVILTEKTATPVFLEKIPSDSINRALNRFEYIGGSNYRKKAISKMPKFRRFIDSLSNVYNIDYDLFMHRISKEGVLDDIIRRYNEGSLNNQRNGLDGIFENYGIADGFQKLGIDDSYSNYMDGRYNLRWSAPRGEWHHDEAINEKERPVKYMIFSNLKDGLEVKAADIEMRRNELKKKYPKLSKDSLNILTNAAYNLGLYHDDLSNFNWVMSQYKYPDYDK